MRKAVEVTYNIEKQLAGTLYALNDQEPMAIAKMLEDGSAVMTDAGDRWFVLAVDDNTINLQPIGYVVDVEMYDEVVKLDTIGDEFDEE